MNNTCRTWQRQPQKIYQITNSFNAEIIFPTLTSTWKLLNTVSLEHMQVASGFNISLRLTHGITC